MAEQRKGGLSNKRRQIIWCIQLFMSVKLMIKGLAAKFEYDFKLWIQLDTISYLDNKSVID